MAVGIAGQASAAGARNARLVLLRARAAQTVLQAPARRVATQAVELDGVASLPVKDAAFVMRAGIVERAGAAEAAIRGFVANHLTAIAGRHTDADAVAFEVAAAVAGGRACPSLASAAGSLSTNAPVATILGAVRAAGSGGGARPGAADGVLPATGARAATGGVKAAVLPGWDAGRSVFQPTTAVPASLVLIAALFVSPLAPALLCAARQPVPGLLRPGVSCLEDGEDSAQAQPRERSEQAPPRAFHPNGTSEPVKP